jgi:hypothetical protein
MKAVPVKDFMSQMKSAVWESSEFLDVCISKLHIVQTIVVYTPDF